MAEPRLVAWLARLGGALSRADVSYALAGGLALAVWSTPRATVDLDLVVTADAAALDRARSACARLGLLQTTRSLVRFRRISMLRMIVPPDADEEPIAVDLLLLPTTLERAVLRRARAIPLGRAPIRVVSAEDLVLLKLLRFSDQDRVDVRALAAQRRLDRRYLERQARELRVLTRLRVAVPSR